MKIQIKANIWNKELEDYHKFMIKHAWAILTLFIIMLFISLTTKSYKPLGIGYSIIAGIQTMMIISYNKRQR